MNKNMKKCIFLCHVCVFAFDQVMCWTRDRLPERGLDLIVTYPWLRLGPHHTHPGSPDTIYTNNTRYPHTSCYTGPRVELVCPFVSTLPGNRTSLTGAKHANSDYYYLRKLTKERVHIRKIICK